MDGRWIVFGRGGRGGGFRNGIFGLCDRFVILKVNLYMGGCFFIGVSGLYGFFWENCFKWKF